MFSSREHLGLIFKVFLLGLATLVLSWLEIEELLELIKTPTYLLVLMYFQHSLQDSIALTIVPTALYFPLPEERM